MHQNLKNSYLNNCKWKSPKIITFKVDQKARSSFQGVKIKKHTTMSQYKKIEEEKISITSVKKLIFS